MKKPTLILVITAALGFSLLADEARHETTVTTNGTADITIADYETGQIVYLDTGKSGVSYSIIKNSVILDNITGSPPDGTIIRGPATFRTVNSGIGNYSAMTVKITPVSFPPNQTLIIPPGTNQVQVSLESSTHLINWAAATNGVYGSPDSGSFFRIRLTNLQP